MEKGNLLQQLSNSISFSLLPLTPFIFFFTASPLSLAPPLSHPHAFSQGQRRRGRLLIFLPWLSGIAAAILLRHGYYGDRQIVLGPSSSRMMETASFFVESLQVKTEGERGVLLYGFNERPKLSLESNWTFSSNLFVDTYNRQGFSMWLNKGSRIWMACEVAAHGGKDYSDMLVVLIKGIRRDYVIDEDNMYYLSVVNLTPRSIVVNMNLKVTSKMYDTSKATSICSTSTGDCKLMLPFPKTQHYVLVTPDSEVALKVSKIQLSFIARLTAYLLIAGFVFFIVSVLLKHLGVLASEETARQEQVGTEERTETDPILSVMEMPCVYGSTEEDPKSSVCSSAEDLYDMKICVICYDAKRDCFFTPCGHCISCYSCGQRRLIHKTRRLASP